MCFRPAQGTGLASYTCYIFHASVTEKLMGVIEEPYRYELKESIPWLRISD